MRSKFVWVHACTYLHRLVGIPRAIRRAIGVIYHAPPFLVPILFFLPPLAHKMKPKGCSFIGQVGGYFMSCIINWLLILAMAAQTLAA